MNELPDEVRQFIARSISSVTQLEALLLLRDNRQREWTVDEISRTLCATARGMADQLNALVVEGLVCTTNSPEPQYRYGPTAGDRLDALAARLTELYQQRRVAVISSIYSEPLHKARSFADAFRIRKDKEER